MLQTAPDTTGTWGSSREEAGIFLKERRCKIPVPRYTRTNTALITSQFLVWTFFFLTTRKFFKVPNLDAQMDYISDLRPCQSPVTLSADLPAVAQRVVRGARGLQAVPQPCPSPAPSLGASYGWPQAGPLGRTAETLDSSTALPFCSILSPRSPPPGIRPSPLPQPHFRKVFLRASPLAEPSLPGYRAPHTPSWSRAAARPLTGRPPLPPSSSPLPPSDTPSAGRPRAAPLPGHPLGGCRPTPSRPSPAAPRAPRPGRPGRTHRGRRNRGPGWLPPHRRRHGRRQRKRGAGRGLAAGGACPGSAGRGGVGRGLPGNGGAGRDSGWRRERSGAGTGERGAGGGDGTRGPLTPAARSLAPEPEEARREPGPCWAGRPGQAGPPSGMPEAFLPSRRLDSGVGRPRPDYAASPPTPPPRPPAWPQP